MAIPMDASSDEQTPDPRPVQGALVTSLDAELDRVVVSEAVYGYLLVVGGGAQSGRVHPLTRNTVVVGRSPDADIRIQDASLSLQHACIIHSQNGFEIEDLGSTNGTFVAGRRVREAPLRHGNHLKLGNVEFTFLRPGETEATVAIASTLANSMGAPVVSHAGAAVGDAPISAEELIRRAVRVAQLLQRHAAALITIIGGAATLALATVLVAPPAPSATALVRLDQQAKANPVEGTFASRDAVQFFTGAERSFVHPQLVETTLKQLGIAKPSPELVSSLELRLRFEPVGERLYEASLRGNMLRRSPVDQVAFLSAHVQNFFTSEIDKTLKVFKGESDFLRSEVAKLEAQMAATKSDLVALQEKNVDGLPDQATAQTSRLQLESRRTELLSSITRLTGELGNSRGQLANEGALFDTKVQQGQPYREALAAVNRKISEATARGLGEQHVEMRQLVAEKDGIQRLLDQQIHAKPTALERRANPTYQGLASSVGSLQAQLRAARAEMGDVERNLRNLRQVAAALPRVDARMQELTRTQDANGRLHAQLYDRLKKTEMQLDIERVHAASRHELVSPPQVLRPGLLKTVAQRLAIGLFLGILIAAGLVAWREGKTIVRRALAPPGGGNALVRR